MMKWMRQNSVGKQSNKDEESYHGMEGWVKENSAAEREAPSIRNEREGGERVGCENSNER